MIRFAQTGLTSPLRVVSRATTHLGVNSYFGLLGLWLLIRTVAWVAVVIVSQPNAPLDLIEWLSWGQSLEWGYSKHPPLPAWLAAGFARLSPGDVWGVYVLSYLVSAGCFIAAWSLARQYLSAKLALVAAICLEGSKYFTNDPAEWSNNVALDLGWAWIIVLAHRAIHHDSTRAWIGVGIATGLTLLCKYTVGIVLVPLAVYLLMDRATRQQFLRPGPYLAAMIAVAIVLPHALWLVQHDLITFTYAAVRSSDARWYARIVNPVSFACGQAVLLAPVAFILWPCFGQRSRGHRYLHFMLFGPVVIVLSLSVIAGSQLRQIWGSPFWTMFGVWALTTFPAPVGHRNWTRSLWRALFVAVGMMVFVLAKHLVLPHFDPKPDRSHYPGRALTLEVNRRWQEQFDQPYPIVAGEAWAAGNICCYSRHHPVLYSSGSMGYLVFDAKACPWMNDEEFKCRGGVIVWDADQLGEQLPMVIRTRFPSAIDQPPILLAHETSAPLPMIRVGLAFVPPNDR